MPGWPAPTGGVPRRGPGWWTGSCALDDPHDEHWGDDGELRRVLSAEPAQVRDRDHLRRLLLQQPWSVEFNAAHWIVQAGIGFLRQDVATHAREPQTSSKPRAGLS
jgi:hypothetical protein